MPRCVNVVARALLLAIAPRGQIRVAAVARCFRIGDHDLHAWPREIVPVLYVLRIALAHQKHHRRRIGRARVGQARAPVRGHEMALLREQIDIVGLVHRHDVGLQALQHRERLRARSAVRLPDRHALAGLLLIVGDEARVDVLVQLARHVVRDVEERRVSVRRRRAQCDDARAEPARRASQTCHGGPRLSLKGFPACSHAFVSRRNARF